MDTLLANLEALLGADYVLTGAAATGWRTMRGTAAAPTTSSRRRYRRRISEPGWEVIHTITSACNSRCGCTASVT